MFDTNLASGLSYLKIWVIWQMFIGVWLVRRYLSIHNTEEFSLAETEGSEEEDKENDKAEETPNDSVLENKVKSLFCLIHCLFLSCRTVAY